MKKVIIRKAEKADLPALTAIYNDAVIHTTATLDLEPRTVADREPWFAQHNQGNHPLIVAVWPGEEKGTADSQEAEAREAEVQEAETREVQSQEAQVVGYASLSDLFDKDAYISTVELSIYVHPEYKGQGIGDRLMREILALARADEITHSVVSKITAGNAASDHLHEKYGFAKVGTLHECAWKFGRLLDMNMYELLV